MTETSGDRIEVEVFHQQIRLRAPADEHDMIRRAAAHADSVVKDIASVSTTADSTRLALQAAFVIARDYIRLMDDIGAGDGLSDEVRSRMSRLDRRIDDSLRELEAMLAEADLDETPGG